METELTVEDICYLVHGIESYFIYDEDEPLGFAEVDISVDFGVYPIMTSDGWKFESRLECVSNGCGTVNFNCKSDEFHTPQEAILDLGKIFNDGEFIRDTITGTSVFWIGPGYQERV